MQRTFLKWFPPRTFHHSYRVNYGVNLKLDSFFLIFIVDISVVNEMNMKIKNISFYVYFYSGCVQAGHKNLTKLPF